MMRLRLPVVESISTHHHRFMFLVVLQRQEEAPEGDVVINANKLPPRM